MVISLKLILEVVGGLMLIILFFSSFFSVQQGTVGVITRFGKFKRIALPGLGMKVPMLDTLAASVSIQNRSTELAFQAITIDQANVYFKAMLLFSTLDSTEETIKNVAFKFNSEKEFTIAQTKTIESSVRSFVASKKQSEILGQRQEIVDYVKNHLDETLRDWGYRLLDIQVTDITFDKAIMDSMAQVSASANKKQAAENEGQALLITKTKTAEAEAAAINLQAKAEKDAAKLRGEGVADFRKAVTEGINESAKILEQNHVGSDMILFSMWTEALKEIALNGKGNVIFFDGSVEGMEGNIRRMMALNQQSTLSQN